MFALHLRCNAHHSGCTSGQCPHAKRLGAGHLGLTSRFSGIDDATLSDMTEIIAKGLGGTVHFDGHFVTIKREGVFARSTVGKGEKRIPVKSITAVQWKAPTGLNNGYISFTIAGGNEKQSRLGRQYLDASKDENSVVLKKKNLTEFSALRDAIEHAIANGGAPAAPASGADEVGRLAALHADGHLTDDEFSAAKARALGL